MFAVEDVFKPLLKPIDDDNLGSKVEFEVQTRNVEIYSTYATTQDIFLRSASTNKVSLLNGLFNEIKEHPYMRMTFDIAWKYHMGKCANYLHTLDMSDYINDIELMDNNRTMGASQLDQTIRDTIAWFRYLSNQDIQMGIFLSLLIMAGDNVLRQVLLHMRCFYKYAKTPTPNPSDTRIIFPSAATLGDDYKEELDESDPDVELIIKRRKEWNDSMVKYRKKVEKSIGITNKETKADKKTKDKKSKKDKSSGGKSKKGKSKGKKKSKGKGKSKPEIDFIQLMPVSIVMKIFSYLDGKDLKNIKKVNKYWDFVATNLTKEVKARKKFNTWIAVMEEEIGPCDPITSLVVKPEHRFLRSDLHWRRAACDLKLYKSLRAMNNKQKKNDPKQANTSLLTEIANNNRLSFNMPADKLEPFARNIPTTSNNVTPTYLHRRPSCIRYDNKKIMLPPIESIPVVGNLLHDSVNVDDPNVTSFEFRPSFYETLESDTESLSDPGFTSTEYVMKGNPFNKNSEIDRLLSQMVARSNAQLLAERKIKAKTNISGSNITTKKISTLLESPLRRITIDENSAKRLKLSKLNLAGNQTNN